MLFKNVKPWLNYSDGIKNIGPNTVRIKDCNVSVTYNKVIINTANPNNNIKV